jgi:hypothetical protein
VGKIAKGGPNRLEIPRQCATQRKVGKGIVGRKLTSTSHRAAVCAYPRLCMEGAVKLDIKTVCQTGFLHGKLYDVANDGLDAVAILGSSNFTPRGLGLQDNGSHIELNLNASDPGVCYGPLKGYGFRYRVRGDGIEDVGLTSIS